jgi:hypothetical protein
MKKKPKHDLIRVGELVGRSLDKGYLGLAREMVRVFEVWEEAVGEYNAAKASPESIKGGRLTVIVASPVWIEHFGYYKAEFMRRINEAAGAPLVSEIVFRVGPTEHLIPVRHKEIEIIKEPPPPKTAPPDDEVFSAAEIIKDIDLKKRMVNLLKRQSQPPK